jgi:phosphoglycolate phosphatase-like HAD superfamily hydrolase
MRGVILDVDGTLVDSNDAHAESWVDAFRERGYDIPYYRVRPLIGMGGERLIEDLASIDADSDEGQEIEAARKELFRRDYLHTVRAFPGVAELLTRMKEQGLKLTVASSSDEEILTKLLALTGASALLESRADASRVERSKPAPVLVHAALELLAVPPDEALMLGDTPYDGVAAHGAKVGFVGLRSGGWSDRDLAGALAIYDDPADLLSHFEASPFATRTVLERRSAS